MDASSARCARGGAALGTWAPWQPQPAGKAACRGRVMWLLLNLGAPSPWLQMPACGGAAAPLWTTAGVVEAAAAGWRASGAQKCRRSTALDASACGWGVQGRGRLVRGAAPGFVRVLCGWVAKGLARSGRAAGGGRPGPRLGALAAAARSRGAASRHPGTTGLGGSRPLPAHAKRNRWAPAGRFVARKIAATLGRRGRQCARPHKTGPVCLRRPGEGAPPGRRRRKIPGPRASSGGHAARGGMAAAAGRPAPPPAGAGRAGFQV